jgi:hypothetical protein
VPLHLDEVKVNVKSPDGQSGVSSGSFFGLLAAAALSNRRRRSLAPSAIFDSPVGAGRGKASSKAYGGGCQ